LSKSVGLPQVKLGWIVFDGPPKALDTALDRYEVIADTYLSVSTSVQIALPRLLSDGEDIRRQIRERICANLRTLRERAAPFPPVSVLTCEGGWSAVMQLPAFQSEEALVLRLIDEDGVVVHPGYFFDFAREAYVVVSLLVEPDAFARGVTRVLARATSRSVEL
jgi:hypothetical protein